jgi:hypothetical protein
MPALWSNWILSHTILFHKKVGTQGVSSGTNTVLMNRNQSRLEDVILCQLEDVALYAI